MYTSRLQALKLLNLNGWVSLDDVLDPTEKNRQIILEALVHFCANRDIPYDFDGTVFRRLSNSKTMQQRQEFGVIPDTRKRTYYASIRKFMISRGVTYRMSLGLNILKLFAAGQDLKDVRYTTVFDPTDRAIQLIPGGSEFFKYSKNTVITTVPPNIMQQAGQNWGDFQFGDIQYEQWFDIDSRRLCIRLIGIRPCEVAYQNMDVQHHG